MAFVYGFVVVKVVSDVIGGSCVIGVIILTFPEL